MNTTIRTIMPLFAFCFAALIYADQTIACVVDQKMETWNGGTSERNLPGYYEWQSFTAGVSAGLCQIDLMFCNSNNILNGKGTLKIYEGTGIAGKLLATQAVTVDGRAYPQNTVFWQSWQLATVIPLLQQNVYTFQFIPVQNGGLPDPYLIQVNTNNAYPGGRNSQRADWDNPFRTYMDASVLPVNLLYFRGAAQAGKIKLDWATSSEVNHRYFTVQRSNDNNRFSNVAIINTKGGMDGRAYSFTDDAPLQGKNYYRLQQTDRDGTVTLSAVIAVAIQPSAGILVYPNPVHQLLHVDNIVPGAVLSIVNASGTVLKTATVNSVRYDADVQELSPGLYFIQLRNGNVVTTHRFIRY